MTSPEKYLKKALGAAPSGILTQVEGTYTFTPTPPPEPPPHMQFIYRLQELGHTMQWYGPTVETTFDAPYVCTVKMACPHGETMEQQVSVQVMDLPKPAGLADLVMQQFQKRCESTHAKTPPPGQFVYSLASPEPIAYAANNGMVYKMEDFKASFYDIQSYVTTSLLKSHNQMLNQYDSYVLYGNGAASVQGISSGNTTSILSELMAICPALGTVRRPCPETACDEFEKSELPLSMLIQHVNDRHQWSREKIADWLDIIALDDPGVDLTIQPKEKKSEQPSIGPGAQEVIVGLSDYGPFTIGGNAIKVGDG